MLRCVNAYLDDIIIGYRFTPSGQIRVRVEPRDAEVLVDGFSVSTENSSEISISPGLFYGRYIEVRKDGYETYFGELPEQQAEEVLLQVTLRKLDYFRIPHYVTSSVS